MALEYELGLQCSQLIWVKAFGLSKQS